MTTGLDIRLKNGAPDEARMRALIIDLVEKYDLAPWLYTTTLVIDRDAMPHSHPILTLNSEWVDDERMALAEFVHEQLHWFEEANADARDNAIEETKQLYPVVPIARPEGAGSEDSTRLHLIVCHLEHQVLKRLLGAQDARAQIEATSRHHYCWVYRTVLADEAMLADLMRRHGLDPEPLRTKDT